MKQVVTLLFRVRAYDLSGRISHSFKVGAKNKSEAVNKVTLELDSNEIPYKEIRAYNAGSISYMT